MGTLRMLVADDHEVVRKGLCALLQERPGWEVAAEASDGREAVRRAKEVNPDIAVLDIAMPTLNGLEATRQITRSLAKTSVLVLTMHESDSLVREALDAGARGYVLKTDAGKDLVGAVEALRRNHFYLGSRMADRIPDGYLNLTNHVSGPVVAEHRLTGRQREIVQLLAEGKSSKEVATVLDISVKTVETHRANIMSRLNCHCITELVRYAIRNHIVEA
jgi:DNA-binding NarL/FixJ family response regulator